MSDPRLTDPRQNTPPLSDPHYPGTPEQEIRPVYHDPAADPRVAHHHVAPSSGGRAGLVAAGIIAVLLVIALVAFSSGPGTDPGTTAVIPGTAEEVAPSPQQVTPPVVDNQQGTTGNEATPPTSTPVE